MEYLMKVLIPEVPKDPPKKKCGRNLRYQRFS